MYLHTLKHAYPYTECSKWYNKDKHSQPLHYSLEKTNKEKKTKLTKCIVYIYSLSYLYIYITLRSAN